MKEPGWRRMFEYPRGFPWSARWDAEPYAGCWSNQDMRCAVHFGIAGVELMPVEVFARMAAAEVWAHGHDMLAEEVSGSLAPMHSSSCLDTSLAILL